MCEYYGADTSDLRKKKLFFFDLDGTVYKDNSLFDGSLELLNLIQTKYGDYVFLTNNSSKSVSDYLKKVQSIGIQAEFENFCTSSQVTARYLLENYPDKLIYCQGTNSMIEEFNSFGISTTTEISDDVGVVVVGFDTELTSEKLSITCQLLFRELPFIATNKDLVCPTSFGFIPDCGSICMMLENATGRKPKYIGKPNSEMIIQTAKRFNCKLDDCVIIGDRLYTDIATGVNAGIASICVLTGESDIEDIQNSEIKPTYIFKSVKEIYKSLL